MLIRDFKKDRKGGIAVMFGLLAVPLVGFMGLAIDYAIYNQTYNTINLAANAAAFNAAKTAGSGVLIGDANYLAEGTTAGQQWFTSQLMGTAGKLSTLVPTVSVTGTSTITATVTYSGKMNSVIGGIFGTVGYPINITATTISPNAPFLNVEVMLDNSPSMLIGATNTDMANLMALTPCSSAGVNAGQAYGAYAVQNGSYKYDGTLAQPTGYVAGGSAPTCTATLTKNLPAGYQPPKNTSATAPCAFACHFDTSKPAGQGNDYLGLARAAGVTLRFDVVKNAVNTLINTMQASALPINNLGVGVFAFNNNLTKVYPTDGTEAGHDWSTALSYVGVKDAGVSAIGGANSAQTNFPGNMTTLANTLTNSGSGDSATDPRKVLFIVTDGMEDYVTSGGARVLKAIEPAYCNTFKNKGYDVYVIYTPYAPLMNGYYLANGDVAGGSLVPVAEGTGTTSISYNLQACASSPANYLVASDQTGLTTALQTFLKQAMIAPARFTH